MLQKVLNLVALNFVDDHIKVVLFKLTKVTKDLFDFFLKLYFCFLGFQFIFHKYGGSDE